MSRNTRRLFNGEDPLCGHALCLVNPVGDCALADTEPLSQRHLPTSAGNSVLKSGKTCHILPYITESHNGASTRSDNALRQSARMPRAAKTSALWERLIRARLDMKPPLPTNQEDIAKEVGVGQTAVSGWKTGDKEPSIKKAAALAKKADICIEFLYTGRGPRRPWGDVTTPLGRLVEVWERLDDTEQGALLSYAELLHKAGDKRDSHDAPQHPKPPPRPPH